MPMKASTLRALQDLRLIYPWYDWYHPRWYMNKRVDLVH